MHFGNETAAGNIDELITSWQPAVDAYLTSHPTLVDRFKKAPQLFIQYMSSFPGRVNSAIEQYVSSKNLDVIKNQVVEMYANIGAYMAAKGYTSNDNFTSAEPDTTKQLNAIVKEVRESIIGMLYPTDKKLHTAQMYEDAAILVKRQGLSLTEAGQAIETLRQQGYYKDSKTPDGYDRGQPTVSTDSPSESGVYDTVTPEKKSNTPLIVAGVAGLVAAYFAFKG